jgi:uncharacterized protein YwgA
MNDELLSYGLLAKIAELGHEKRINVNREKLQKLVFLLSELEPVDTGYRFRFFTYGPFSSALAGDVDYLSHIGVFEPQDNERSSICLGRKAQKVRDLLGERLKDQEQAIEKVVDAFGDLSTKQLEVLSTLVYVKSHTPPNDNQSLVSKTKQLKPSLPDNVIEECIDSLSRIGYLQSAAA